MDKNARIVLGRMLLLLLLFPCMALSQNSAASTWESLGPEGGYLTALAQNPLTGDLFAVPYGSPARIYKSTNEGNTWQKVAEINDVIYYLIVDPQTPANMYAASSYLGYETSLRIYKSTNSGVTWTQKVFAGESATGYQIAEFTMDKSDPSKLSVVGYCYRWDGSTNIYRPYVCRSSDAGQTWTVRKFDNVSSDDFYAYCMETDPSAPNTQFLAGYLSNTGGRLFKTTDNGTTWTNITGTVIQGYVYDLLIDGASPNKIYAASYSGVYRSTDRGATWQRNNGVATGLKLLFDPQNSSILYVYGNGLPVYRSTDGGVNWMALNSQITGGTVTGLVVNASMTNKIYVTTHAGFYRSDNTGQDWTMTNGGMLCSYVPTLKCAPSSPSTLYISFMYSGFYRTNNALASATGSGISWEKMPEYSYCEGIMHMDISTASPPVLYIQEGAG